MAPSRAVRNVQKWRARARAARERDFGPRRPALTSAERVRRHRERVRLSQAQEPQSSTSAAGTSGGHGVNSNNYYPEAQSQPTTSNDQVTCIYIEPKCNTYTDWLTEANKVMEEPNGTDKIQLNPLALEVSGAKQPFQKIAIQPRPKKPKETDNLLTERTSKRFPRKSNYNPNQSNDVSEDFSNDFNVFGRFVATQLKNLNDDDAVLAQSEIQEVLIRYRLNKIETRYEVPIEHLPSGNESVQPGSETEVTTADEVLIMKCEPDSE